MLQKRGIFVALFLISISFLNGCSQIRPAAAPSMGVGAAMGGVSGALIGTAASGTSDFTFGAMPDDASDSG